MKAQSGAWFFQGHKEKNGNLFGSLLVRQSLRRLPGIQPKGWSLYSIEISVIHKGCCSLWQSSLGVIGFSSIFTKVENSYYPVDSSIRPLHIRPLYNRILLHKVWNIYSKEFKSRYISPKGHKEPSNPFIEDEEPSNPFIEDEDTSNPFTSGNRGRSSERLSGQADLNSNQ